jgi:hypothetical protein
MNLSVNAKKLEEYAKLKHYVNSLNDFYVDQKSKIYSFDFKRDGPAKSFDSDDSTENLGSSLRVQSEVKFQWEELEGNMIGRKIRKSSDIQIKRKLQNMFANRRRSNDSESNSNENIKNVSSPLTMRISDVNMNLNENLDK